MLLKRSGIRLAIIAVALVTGMAVGTLGFGLAIADTFSNQGMALAPIFPQNENGQTYGSGSDAISLETEPDLIKAYGVGGTLGYVRSKDLIGELPKTPQEALAQQQNRAEGSIRPIPLYAVDGETVIGVFNVTTGQITQHSSKK